MKTKDVEGENLIRGKEATVPVKKGHGVTTRRMAAKAEKNDDDRTKENSDSEKNQSSDEERIKTSQQKEETNKKRKLAPKEAETISVKKAKKTSSGSKIQKSVSKKSLLAKIISNKSI